MNVKEAHEALRQLIEDGKGALELYTEYERVERFSVTTAPVWRDGSQLELEDGESFVFVYTDH